MKDIQPSGPKQQLELAMEWDSLAEERHRQIASGEDLSFDYVLAPLTLRLLRNANTALVLDVGSGTGDFTARLASVATRVIGLEPSHNSITVAKATCLALPNVRFIETPVEQAANLLRGESATAAVACMSLMTAPHLEGFAGALAELLQEGSKFIATLPHPWFWPRYWGYETAEWFNYSKETFIEAPFVISKCRTEIRTTHIHRPLEQYVGIIGRAGFRLEMLVEPMPSPEIQILYPHPWQFPRFIGLQWEKTA